MAALACVAMVPSPEKPLLDGLESKWDALWQDQGTYRFDRTKPRDEIYSIDTPPPTISGFLHLGTAFGYIQVDVVARFRRMVGAEVFYPMGWDDNGLPTERRAQKHYGVRCDPSLPYDPDLMVTEGVEPERPISRPNFVELCQRLTQEFEHDFEQQWRKMGLSVDWSLTYATIDTRSRRVAQRAFLRNLARGEAYASAAPTMWDVDFQTAVAQAESEDRPVSGAFHRLAFARADGGPAAEIETTRPELLPSCVALVAHPDDERYVDLVGTEVVTPVFGVRVPVVAHRLADPEKGSGIAMICTFGDTTDVVWWRELDLPTRSVICRDGRFQEEVPEWLNDAGAQAWTSLAGLTSKQARRQLVELLTASGDLIGEVRPITHDVKFYEKGERPLEIVTSRQWYIRNGARDSAAARHADRARVRAGLAPGVHAAPLRALGRGAQHRLAGQPAALLRRAVPDLVPAERRGRNDLGRPDPGRRCRAADRAGDRRAARLPGITAWAGRRFHRGSRRDGHLGDVLAHPADRRRLGG